VVIPTSTHNVAKKINAIARKQLQIDGIVIPPSIDQNRRRSVLRESVRGKVHSGC
jgi:hypothetical protein